MTPAPTLESLPAELLLRILAYLPVQALRSLRLASRSWNAFFLDNESTIYHHAAVLHRFIDSIYTLLPEAKAARKHNAFLQDVPDWYHYCRQYFRLQLNWAGHGSATVRYYGGHPYDIHRLKVDELHGLLIVTHEFGGLTVFDLDTAVILWRLDGTYIRRYAHCEYENGFLVFDRMGSCKEVWRLDVLFDESEMPQISTPDEDQIEAWKRASRDYSATSPFGHFRPWALLESPEFGRAYRFVYPNLLVSGLRRAFLWDVRTGQLLLEVDHVQGTDDAGGDINYVELSGTHIFVCSTSALRVFSTENGALVFELKSYQFVYSDVRLAVQLDPSIARRKVAGPAEVVSLPARPTMTTALYTAAYAEFSAVHVSRDGKDMVAQMSDSRLIFVRDFMRVVRGEVPLRTAALEVGKTVPRLGSPEEHFSIYLSYECNRLGIVTTSGLYAAILDPTYHGVIDEDLVLTGRREVHGVPAEAVAAGVSFPYVNFVSLPFYHDRRQLSKVTCIQITETKLFFVWDAMYKPDNIEFFRRLGVIGGAGDALGGYGYGEEEEGEDDLAQGLFTTAATLDQAEALAQAQAQAMQGAEGHEGGADDTDEDDADEDSDGSEESDSDDDGNHGAPPHGLQHPFGSQPSVATGPMVFCIDFSPQ